MGKKLLSIFSVHEYQNLWRLFHVWYRKIYKYSRFFHKICLGKLTFHKTIRKKQLVYSYQEKLTYKKVQNRQSFFNFFLFRILSIVNLLKKSEIIFKHYFTIIRPKNGLFFDKVKLHYFFTLTMLNLNNGLV